MNAQITVTGLVEVQRMLSELPKAIVAKGYLNALSAAGNVLKDEVDARTPIRLEVSGEDLLVSGGDLKAALMMKVELDTGLRGGSVDIGFGKQGYKANWVEYGHRMVGHKPGKKALGQVPPHPFLRPAFDAKADEAIAVFAESLENTLRTSI